MPFYFPPPSSDESKIRLEVENVKARIGFNDKVRDHVAAKLARFSVTREADVKTARATLDTYIRDRINPEIQRIILDTTSTYHHIYFEIPSPRSRRINIEHYQGLSLCEDVTYFEEDSQAICRGIYDDPLALKYKPVAIRNLLKFAFWIKVKYLIDPDKTPYLNSIF